MRGQVALIFVLAFLTIAQCALMNYRLPARRSGSHVKHRHHEHGAQEIRKQFVEKTMEAEWYRRTSWFFNELLQKYKTHASLAVLKRNSLPQYSLLSRAKNDPKI